MERIYLYLLLAVAFTVIMALLVIVMHYRSKFNKCKTTLVRYINENIEMKEKLPEYELSHFISTEELTPEEFSRIIKNMLKRVMFAA